MSHEDYDAIFMPGGHGPMFDLATDATAKRLIGEFWEARKPVAAVCHGPAALLNVPLSDGTTLLHGRRVTGFSHGEDSQDALFAKMPFSLQDRMTLEGADFVAGPPPSAARRNGRPAGHGPESGIGDRDGGSVPGSAGAAGTMTGDI